MPEHLKRSAADLHLPRYAEIRRALEEAIMSGAWRPGRRVPSEHALMEQFGCSRMTVNKALSALAEAGLILRKRRSGSFVASPASEPHEEVRWICHRFWPGPSCGASNQRSHPCGSRYDGQLYLWVGNRKTAGRGEGSSGLRFDWLDD